MIPKSGNRFSEQIMLQRNICLAAHNMDAAHRAAWEGKIVASRRRINDRRTSHSLLQKCC
jgi:hypothetical protein